MNDSGALFRWTFAKGDEQLSVTVDGPLTLDADDLMLSAAIDGVGLAMLNEADVEGHLTAGTLIRVLTDWCPPISGFSCTSPESAALRDLAGAHRLLDLAGDTRRVLGSRADRGLI